MHNSYLVTFNEQFILGGQICIDNVNIQQNGRDNLNRNMLGIVPRLSFTCNGRITSIRARVIFSTGRSDYPFFQVWRPLSSGSTIYNKIGEAQLQSDDQVTRRGNSNFGSARITLTDDDRIEFQSGDVIGYYHPPDARYRVRTIRTDGYRLYRFNGSPAPISVDLNNADGNNNGRQPLIQFDIGEWLY